MKMCASRPFSLAQRCGNVFSIKISKVFFSVCFFSSLCISLIRCTIGGNIEHEGPLWIVLGWCLRFRFHYLFFFFFCWCNKFTIYMKTHTHTHTQWVWTNVNVFICRKWYFERRIERIEAEIYFQVYAHNARNTLLTVRAPMGLGEFCFAWKSIPFKHFGWTKILQVFSIWRWCVCKVYAPFSTSVSSSARYCGVNGWMMNALLAHLGIFISLASRTRIWRGVHHFSSIFANAISKKILESLFDALRAFVAAIWFQLQNCRNRQRRPGNTKIVLISKF